MKQFLDRFLPYSSDQSLIDLIRPVWISIGLCLSIILFTGIELYFGLKAALISGFFIMTTMPAMMYQVQLSWDVAFYTPPTKGEALESQQQTQNAQPHPDDVYPDGIRSGSAGTGPPFTD